MYFCFFFNDTATTEIYTLSLHDALPICRPRRRGLGQHEALHGPLPGVRPRANPCRLQRRAARRVRRPRRGPGRRSEEHTSELQSRQYLVCRLLLEKKKKKLSPTHLSLL